MVQMILSISSMRLLERLRQINLLLETRKSLLQKWDYIGFRLFSLSRDVCVEEQPTKRLRNNSSNKMKDNVEFACKYCTFVACNKPTLHEHTRSLHTNKNRVANTSTHDVLLLTKQHLCTECGRQFTYRSLLERHFSKVGDH